MTTKEAGEPFLERWSRLKREGAESAPAKPPEMIEGKAAGADSPAPDVPAVEDLTIDSDYRAFFHPKVSEDTRRAALKKLFSDPHFNVMDGLDVYIDDYSKTEPIPPAMLAGLRQAQKILEWAKGDDKDAPRERARTEEIAASPRASLEPGTSMPEPRLAEDDPVAGAAQAAADPVAGTRGSRNS